jgi:hypothetical protein
MNGRPDYAPGAYLGADVLLGEQRYRRQRLRRHNRYLHGWGIVCGLWVVPANDSARPWSVRVCPGYAIGPYGDEIAVPESVPVDVRDYLWARPESATGPARVAYVGIRYAEDSRRLVAMRSARCKCEDPAYRPSRLRDSFQVDVLWELLPDAGVPGFDLCAGGPAPCPDCPESPYVILARLTLPESEGDSLTAIETDAWALSR